MAWYYILLICIASYMLCSINFGVIIARIKKVDIRKQGSGNPGTMNMMRTVGVGWGVITFIFDAGKGIAIALIGRFLFPDDVVTMTHLLGFCVIMGHVYPVLHHFNGGKGVATMLGVFCVIHPIIGPCVFVGLCLYILFAKIGFIGSLLAVSAFAITTTITCSGNLFAMLLAWLIWAAIIIAHRKNIERFL